jgi:hypothetical protein
MWRSQIHCMNRRPHSARPAAPRDPRQLSVPVGVPVLTGPTSSARWLDLVGQAFISNRVRGILQDTSRLRPVGRIGPPPNPVAAGGRDRSPGGEYSGCRWITSSRGGRRRRRDRHRLDEQPLAQYPVGFSLRCEAGSDPQVRLRRPRLDLQRLAWPEWTVKDQRSDNARHGRAAQAGTTTLDVESRCSRRTLRPSARTRV